MSNRSIGNVVVSGVLLRNIGERWTRALPGGALGATALIWATNAGAQEANSSAKEQAAPAQDMPPEALRDRLEPLLSLARLPNVHVKILGAYATSAPHAFPHRGANDAIGRILEAFGAARCQWASDLPPALDFVSFPQTMEWQGKSALSETEQGLIFRDNLVRLLAGL